MAGAGDPPSGLHVCTAHTLLTEASLQRWRPPFLRINFTMAHLCLFVAQHSLCPHENLASYTASKNLQAQGQQRPMTHLLGLRGEECDLVDFLHWHPGRSARIKTAKSCVLKKVPSPKRGRNDNMSKGVKIMIGVPMEIADLS